MTKLIDGFVRFKRNVYPDMRPLFKLLADGQNPLALFITCADSRVQPSLLTQTDPGDLFICRNAGNIVPPHGGTQGGVSSTIEYAVQALKVPDIIVCGHTDCGAVKAMLHPEKLTDLPLMASWLNHSEAARRVVVDHAGERSEGELVEMLIYENVLTQITHLTTHPAVASALARGKVRLHGWVYDFVNGRLKVYDATEGHFVEIDEGRTVEPPNATPPLRRLHREAIGAGR